MMADPLWIAEKVADEFEAAYATDIFTEVPDAELVAMRETLERAGFRHPFDRLHAGWGRHFDGVIRRRARAILEEATE